MHAAIIAAEVRRTINPKRKVDLQSFMLMDPRKRAKGTVAAFIATLKAAAGGRKHVSEAIKRPVRSKAVKRGQNQPVDRRQKDLHKVRRPKARN